MRRKRAELESYQMMEEDFFKILLREEKQKTMNNTI